ncbi:MAG TPA: hypothetical protein VFJ85_14570 [Acidimicrobiales bacterium]|nr:hypothetical protein [Acidimicrobiales bacterium]
MRRRPDAGSALMLAPAAVLVLIVLGAIAVDSAVVVLGQRELSTAATAAANDAAAAALSDAGFYGHDGAVDIDQTRASQVVNDVLEQADLRGVHRDGSPDVEVVGPGQVCVRLTGHVDAIFARAVPGVPRTHTVHGRATATAVRGAADAAGTPTTEPLPPGGDC